jgi:mannose/fructose/N-acetylgalactosamine-specific phosphotransferase system component IIC
MLSAPLVTATVLGILWNDLPLALEVGVVLQILAATTMPVGSRTPEDYAVGGVVGSGLALALSSSQAFTLARDGCALLGVIGGLLAAIGGVPLLKWQRRRHEGLARWCEAELMDGRAAALPRSHAAAVSLSFATGATYCAACLGVGIVGLGALARDESLWLVRAWSFGRPLWLGFGLALLLRAFVQRRLWRVVAFAAALLMGWLALMIESS